MDIRAAEIATREMNAGYLTAMMEGRYTDRWLRIMGNDAPRFTAEELKVISLFLAASINSFTE